MPGQLQAERASENSARLFSRVSAASSRSIKASASLNAWINGGRIAPRRVSPGQGGHVARGHKIFP